MVQFPGVLQFLRDLPDSLCKACFIICHSFHLLFCFLLYRHVRKAVGFRNDVSAGRRDDFYFSILCLPKPAMS